MYGGIFTNIFCWFYNGHLRKNLPQIQGHHGFSIGFHTVEAEISCWLEPQWVELQKLRANPLEHSAMYAAEIVSIRQASCQEAMIGVLKDPKFRA